MTSNVYIHVSRVSYRSRPSALVIAGACLGMLLFLVASCFMRSAYDEAKTEFVDTLSRQKKVAEINKTLKTEFHAVTQKGYMELVAQERLGLKKPKDEEVVVLR